MLVRPTTSPGPVGTPRSSTIVPVTSTLLPVETLTTCRVRLCRAALREAGFSFLPVAAWLTEALTAAGSLTCVTQPPGCTASTPLMVARTFPEVSTWVTVDAPELLSSPYGEGGCGDSSSESVPAPASH